jgi:hypothetical protein
MPGTLRRRGRAGRRVRDRGAALRVRAPARSGSHVRLEDHGSGRTRRGTRSHRSRCDRATVGVPWRGHERVRPRVRRGAGLARRLRAPVPRERAGRPDSPENPGARGPGAHPMNDLAAIDLINLALPSWFFANDYPPQSRSPVRALRPEGPLLEVDMPRQGARS